MKNSSKYKNDNTGDNIKNPGIVVVGNMNVGKSTLFSQICTGKTSAFKIPGNSVPITSGNIKCV